MTPRAKVRLRRVDVGDFRKSEATMFMALPAKVRASLHGNDAVCFISRKGSQIVFVYGFTDVGITKGDLRTPSRKYGIITSVRLRLTASKFNPMMLQNYAADCGIELEGIKRFEEYYARLAEAA